VVVAYMGAVAPEAIQATGLMAEDRRDVGLLAVTSADRLNAGWTAAMRARERGFIWARYANIAVSARSVLNNEWFAKPFCQPLSDQARGDVRPASGWKTDNPAHRTCRIALRTRNPRYSRQRGNARGQMQEFAAGKFHGALPGAG
jgi:hypothetical protein